MCLIGQATGEIEVIRGEPFVGPAGSELDRKLSSVGIPRQMCYITNLVKQKPPRNDFSIYWKGNHPTQALLTWKAALLNELEEVETNVFVALGGDALWSLTGHKDIGNWRGSVLDCQLPSGRIIKVIGTYHPSAILQSGGYSRLKVFELGRKKDINVPIGAIMLFDLQKALIESQYSEIRRKERKLFTMPTASDIVNTVHEFSECAKEISFDIETSNYGIKCIALSYFPEAAISIPTTVEYWGSTIQLKNIIEGIAYLLTKPDVTRVGQFLTFDIQYIMRLWGILPGKPWYDTALAHHACYLELPKGLDFMTSIYTDVPFYKSDLRTWKAGLAEDKLLYEYNAKDACVTLECKKELDNELNEFGTRPIFELMCELLEPAIFMGYNGIKVDKSRMAEVAKELQEVTEAKKQEIESRLGINIGSPKQLAEYAYKTLNIKPIINRKTGRPTMNTKALDKLTREHPVFGDIKEIREKEKLLNTYAEQPLDVVDERWKFSLNIAGTETIRMSSSESIFGCGGNIQNIPESLRDMFIPDEGLEFTEFDLIGAEAMVMAYLMDDVGQIKVFAENRSIHAYNGALIYDTTEEAILEEYAQAKAEHKIPESKYYKAKRITHSANYMASYITLSEILKIQGGHAKKLLAKYHNRCPNLGRYHREIAAHLRVSRVLTTPLGVKRTFYGRYSDSLVREAIAFIPQSTVVHVLNIGLSRIYKNLCSQHEQISLMAQVHDSVLIQHPPEMRSFIHKELHELTRVDLSINGKTFYIPISIRSGPNWRDLK